MTVISVISLKGGEGKTTTAIALGSIFAKQGNKTLLIDLDPQQSLSDSITGLYEDIYREGSRNIAQVLMTDRGEQENIKKCIDDLDDAIIETSIEGLHLVTSSKQLSGFDYYCGRTSQHRNNVDANLLKLSISEKKKEYDIIIIDCLSQTNLLTLNALAACDYFIVPVSPTKLSQDSLRIALHSIHTQKATLRQPETRTGELLGILITRVKNLKSMRSHIQKIKRDFEGDNIIFNTEIIESYMILEASLNCLDVHTYSKRCKVAKQYEQVAKEIKSRLEKKEINK